MKMYKKFQVIVIAIITSAIIVPTAHAGVPKEPQNVSLSKNRVAIGEAFDVTWYLNTTGGITKCEVAGEQRGIIDTIDRVGLSAGGMLNRSTRVVYQPGIYQYKVRSVVGVDPTLWSQKVTVEVYALPPVIQYFVPVGGSQHSAGSAVTLHWSEDKYLYAWEQNFNADYFELWVKTPRDNEMWLLEQIMGNSTTRTPNQVGTYTYGLKACNDWECSDMITLDIYTN